MQKYGVTAEQAAGGSPDLGWLRDDTSVKSHFYLAGDELPFGARAFPGSPTGYATA